MNKTIKIFKVVMTNLVTRLELTVIYRLVHIKNNYVILVTTIENGVTTMYKRAAYGSTSYDQVATKFDVAIINLNN